MGIDLGVWMISTCNCGAPPRVVTAMYVYCHDDSLSLIVIAIIAKLDTPCRPSS